MPKAGKEAEVGLRPGLEGEGQDGEEDHCDKRGESGEALAGVAGHGERVARAVGGRKGVGPLSTRGQGGECQGFQGVGCGR